MTEISCSVPQNGWRRGIQRNPRTVGCLQTNPPRADNSGTRARARRARPALPRAGRPRAPGPGPLGPLPGTEISPPGIGWVHNDQPGTALRISLAWSCPRIRRSPTRPGRRRWRPRPTRRARAVRTARCRGLHSTKAGMDICQHAAQSARLPLPVGRQRNVGPAGVLTSATPCGLAMPDQPQLRIGEPGAGPRRPVPGRNRPPSTRLRSRLLGLPEDRVDLGDQVEQFRPSAGSTDALARRRPRPPWWPG